MRAGHRRKESTRSENEKENTPLVDRVAVVPEVCNAVLSAALKALKHDSVDVKALWSRTIYRYVLLILYIVDDTGRHDIDFGTEGLINYLSIFQLLSS